MKRLIIYYICFLLLIPFILLGCARTSGIYNENLTEDEPYIFTYNGNSEEAISYLNEKLLTKGFTIISEDKYEGGLSYVFEKTLSDDEQIERTKITEYVTGKSVSDKKGRLVFVVSSTSGGVTVQMTPRLVAKTQQSSKYDPSTEVEEVEEVHIPQGHPLPMKYGRMLAQIDGWKLKDPPRSEVFMNEGATQGESASEGDITSATETPKSEERPGNGGDDIEWVQKTLNELGHACGPEDGIMGPKTRSCIRSFQRANDLEVTGKVNEATYQKMLEKQ